ncbi:MAG: SHOCT domain-containing protein [Rhodospirillales bacterium]
MMNGLTRWTLAAVFWAVPLAALAQGRGDDVYGYGHMYGVGWGHTIFGFLMMLLVIAAVVVLVVLLVRWLGGMGHGLPAHGPGGRTALDILKERYARGEIDTKEFEERKKALGD